MKKNKIFHFGLTRTLLCDNDVGRKKKPRLALVSIKLHLNDTAHGLKYRVYGLNTCPFITWYVKRYYLF